MAESTDEEDNRRLEPTGQWHLGEFVNKFQRGSTFPLTLPGSLVMELPDVPSVPSVIFGTVSGMLGIVGSISAEDAEFFSSVEKAAANTVSGIGSFAHDEYRSFWNERKTQEAQGFIDGDLVELLLELPQEQVPLPNLKSQVDKIATLVGIPSGELITRIETLARALH